jgi:glycosyltransferase involved in cell wall biosynthesis
MRVAYVLDRYPELSQTFVEAELRELRRVGLDLDVLAMEPGAGAELAEAGFEATHPPRGTARASALVATGTRAPLVAARFLSAHGFWPPDGRRLRGLARVSGWRVAAARADHLHAHFAAEATDVAELLGLLTGRPHSFTGHSTDLFADPQALRHRLAAAVFATLVCEYDRREVERLAPGIGRLEVVPLGLDLKHVRRRTGYEPAGPVVAVGRLVEHKGFADLVAVAPELDGHEVVVAGDGPLRVELEAEAGGGPVSFAGALSPTDARRLVERASVLAVPSVVARDGSRDGIPMVLKEAQALGVPVVASDAVGNPEAVASERGALHPAGDRSALAAALRSVLARPAAEREAMGRAGRAWAERHADVRRQAARLRELFEAAAELNRPR